MSDVHHILASPLLTIKESTPITTHEDGILPGKRGTEISREIAVSHDQSSRRACLAHKLLAVHSRPIGNVDIVHFEIDVSEFGL